MPITFQLNVIAKRTKASPEVLWRLHTELTCTISERERFAAMHDAVRAFVLTMAPNAHWVELSDTDILIETEG